MTLLEVRADDKRLVPEDNGATWCYRQTERDRHHCKFCGHDVPTFVLVEGRVGSYEPVTQLRCCWECGGGLEPLAPDFDLESVI